MEKKKLLIADQSEEFRQALQCYLQEDYEIELCWEGNETEKRLESFRPDLVILDVLLPGVDGLTVLKNLRARGSEAAVMVITRFCSNYLLQNLEALDVGYVMSKPCNLQAVAAHLQEMAAPCRELHAADVQEMVNQVLLQLHFPSHMRGYHCLREAVLEKLQNPNQQMKSLYLTVAGRCGSNMERVEKAIRDVTRKAWERRDDAVWSRYFGTDQNGIPIYPTNNECICTLAEHVRAQMQKSQRYFGKIG